MLITGQLPYFIRPGISFNKRPRSNFALRTKHIFATLQLAPTSYFFILGKYITHHTQLL